MTGSAELACREFVELVTDYRERALPADLRERFEAHLDVCAGCRRYLGQMAATVRALGLGREGRLPRAVVERLLRRVRGHLARKPHDTG